MKEPATARHLRVVTDTGEVHEFEDAPEIQKLRDEIKGLERALKRECRAHEELKRDKDAEARAHQLWPKAMIVFDAWKKATGHPNAVWTSDRFWVVEPFLTRKEYGPDVCLRAIAGIAFDHFSVRRKNGSVRKFDEFERPFKSAADLEERANAAPKGWRDDPVFAGALQRINDLKGGGRA